MTADDGRPVTDEEVGQRLDVVLVAEHGWSRSRAADAIRTGEVTVDGDVVRPSHKLRAGQRLRMVAPAAAAPAGPAPAVPPLRFVDEHLLVVAKPAGLVVHPGAGHPDGTLVDALRAADIPLAPAGGEGRPGIVHRLDRDTSGLLVVACTDTVHAALVGLLRHRAVTRRYLALVDGVPRSARGRIEAPIGRHPTRRRQFATVSGGKDATTRYRVIAAGEVRGRPVALISCALETGRTHQIRVHLEAIGHPVLGDPVYGHRPTVNASLGATRPFLHAGRLAFDHPVTGGRIDVVEPLPDDLVAVLRAAAIEPPDVAAVLADDEVDVAPVIDADVAPGTDVPPVAGR